MDNKNIIEILNSVKEGKCSIEEAYKNIQFLPFKDLDFAKLDINRKFRQGFTEAVYCPGKTSEQIAKIMLELTKSTDIVLATKADPDKAKEVIKKIPEAQYDCEAKIITLGQFPKTDTQNYALIITAGTADIPIAKESYITLKSNGIKTESIYDCGVAGPHRIFQHIELIQNAKAIIVIAGMEGALASLVGGISPCPVIAVPTSTGYGANFNGLTPLMAMLNSCASCISVVNIDNGYSAGIISSILVKQSK